MIQLKAAEGNDMKKHILAFILILFMAFFCSLESWGGGTDVDSYNFYKEEIHDILKPILKRCIGGCTISCFVTDRGIMTFPGCDIHFSNDPNPNASPGKRTHDAQGATNMIANHIRTQLPTDFLLETFVGGHLVYQIYYLHALDVFQFGMVAQW